jgi:hypothetical protein
MTGGYFNKYIHILYIFINICTYVCFVYLPSKHASEPISSRIIATQCSECTLSRDPCGRQAFLFTDFWFSGSPSRFVYGLWLDVMWWIAMTGCDDSVTAEEAKDEYDAGRGGVVRAMFACSCLFQHSTAIKNRKPLKSRRVSIEHRSKSTKTGTCQWLLKDLKYGMKMFAPEWKMRVTTVGTGFIPFHPLRCA